MFDVWKMDKEKAKIYHRMIEVKNKICDYRFHGAKYIFNTATGESDIIPRKLSETEQKDLDKLNLELKQLENKLREVNLQEDF